MAFKYLVSLTARKGDIALQTRMMTEATGVELHTEAMQWAMNELQRFDSIDLRHVSYSEDADSITLTIKRRF